MLVQQTKTIRTKSDAINWRDQLDKTAPKVGDMAPDFSLADVRDEQTVRLSAFRGQRPVALIFGSFT